MLNYALRRIPSALVVLAVGSVLIFALLRLVPGDPAMVLAGPDAPPEAIDALRAEVELPHKVAAVMVRTRTEADR